jgi:hypothetical protein
LLAYIELIADIEAIVFFTSIFFSTGATEFGATWVLLTKVCGLDDP